MPKTIRVVAPATLEEDYTFDVLLEGRPITVKVPVGGVQEGQEFEIPHDDDEATLAVGNSQDTQDEEQTAEGRWKHSLCSCFDVLTQATFWMALCCLPVSIAQLVTRLNLNWKGQAVVDDEEVSLSFNKIVLSFVAVLIVSNLLPVVGFGLLTIYLLTVLIWIGSNLRMAVRKRYTIPAKSLLEDCCCMACCGCCATIQMARQTHNDKEYPGYCCTTTGLELGAPKLA